MQATIAAGSMEMSKTKEGGRAPEPGRSAQHAVVRDVPAIVGQNLKRLRKSQGHSLERLAELSGVSRAMLGQIETAKSVPTVSLLWKIADALGVPIASLIATGNGTTTTVLTGDKTTVLASSDGRFLRRHLFPLDRFRGTEFYELRIGPRHREVSDALPAGARENLVVAKGALSITVGSERAIALAEGDAILFEADVVHAYENPGDTEALAYLVVSHCNARGA
jgi:transcriptional regulator with XRE-family HTH domain